MREDGEGIRRAGAVLVGGGGMTGVPVAGGSSVFTCQTRGGGEQSQLFLCSKPISACTQLTLGLYCRKYTLENLYYNRLPTLIKRKGNFPHTYREIQSGSGGNSYMYEEGLLIYEEMRKYLTIYEDAVSHI